MKSIIWIAAIAIPTIAGAQELWHVGAPADVYGIYYMVPINAQVGGRAIEKYDNRGGVGFQGPNMNAQTKQETMLGRIDAKVKDVVYKDLACKYYDSTYTQQANRALGIKGLRRRVESWIDFKGVVKRVKTYYEDERKILTIEAIFEKDTIEMDLVENGRPLHLSMNPIQGVSAFNSPIPELIKNATKDRVEKIWCMIDPATGGILQYAMRVKGRFVPPVGSSSKIKGWTLELKAPKGIHTMHVSEDGQLRQIDYSDTSVVRAVMTSTIGGTGSILLPTP
jgi:hypothetical protein